MALLVMSLGVAGCQGDAGTGGVAAEQAKAFHRTDRFQSVARGGDRLLAVGAFGAALVSSDGGDSWTRNDLPGAPGLIRAAACGNGTFLSLDFGGQLWRGGKDGKGWDAVKVPATDVVLDMTCTGDNQVWVVGARGAIFSSADMGQTWADKSLPEDIQLLNVQFPTASTGIITGEFGRVLVSHDGGGKWAEAGSLGPDFYPQGMDFSDEQHGVVVGLSGAVQETKDGGATWVRSKAPTEAPLYGVLTAASGQTVVVGAAGTAFVGNGSAWKPLAGAPGVDLRGVAAIPSGLMLAGAGTLAALPASAVTPGTN